MSATDTVANLWNDFLSSESPYAGDATGSEYTSWHFGHGAEMADELLRLVLGGGKRATAGALWTYEHEGDTVPRPGDFSIVTDGAGIARCILRTTQVDVLPFDEVGAEFAAAEGEGDLSLAYWREGHWRYFSAELAGFGRTAQSDMPVVCERFEVVYPLEVRRP